MPRPKTRSKSNVSSAQETINSDVEEPLKLLILPQLPKYASEGARICTLPHPRTSKPCRYYYCPAKGPQNGLYEFTRTAPPSSTCQSWLIARQQETGRDALESDPGSAKSDSKTVGSEQLREVENQSASKDARPVADGYVIKSPELFIATPIDPLFLILPSLLATLNAESPSSRGVFLSFDDILEPFIEVSPHFGEILKHESIQHKMIGRMKAVCDMVAAGDEDMYRLNVDKLLTELLAKATKMAASGLPPSMEQKFVRKALERPIMAIKREASSISAAAESRHEETATIDPASAESTDSQASASTSISTSSEASAGTNITIPDERAPLAPSSDIAELLRIKVALSYMFSAYMPQSLVTTLNAKLAAEDSPIDLGPLEKELALISEMRREALASRSYSDFSRKRGIEDEEATASRAEKKAKKEEDEKKRKASETRGVRDLKKADTTGMKKMSDFFAKKPTAIRKK
jgi:hypothetical protein